MNCSLPLRSPLFFLLLIVFGNGCATIYIPTPLPVTHPANATALEAPPPSPSQAFQSEAIPLPSADHLPAQHLPTGHGTMSGMHGGQ